MYDKLNETFLKFWNNLIDALPNLLAAIVFLLVFILIGYWVGKIFEKSSKRRWKDPIVINFAGQVVKWFFYLTGLVSALYITGLVGLANSLLAGAGISAIIFGFAFKDIAENFLAGILLAINRPFNTGNIIEVDGFKGTVRGMDLRSTHIRNIEGKDIYIPNSRIVKNVVINYTKDGLLRQDFMIGLDLSTDVNHVREIIIAYLKEHPLVLEKPESNLIIKQLGEFTIDVQVLFWVDILKQRAISPSYLGATIRSQIINDVRERLLANNVNMPSQILEHKMYNKEEPILVVQK